VTGLLDAALVAAALAASVLYALLRLGPKAWRRRWSAGFGSLAARSPVGSARRRLWLKLAGRSGVGACGGCDDCGTGAASAEVHVPVRQIGRRG
jgi:hypothetical protein